MMTLLSGITTKTTLKPQNVLVCTTLSGHTESYAFNGEFMLLFFPIWCLSQRGFKIKRLLKKEITLRKEQQKAMLTSAKSYATRKYYFKHITV